MHKHLAGIMAIILLGVVGAAFMYKPEVAEAPASPLQPAVAVGTIVATTSAYVIDARYPIFGITNIDEQIVASVQGAVDDLKAAEAPPEDSAVEHNTFTGIYTDPYVGADFVSVKLILSQYTGGAHGSTLVSGQTFDKRTGQRLTLPDVLPLIGKTVSELSDIASADLKAKLGDTFAFPEGADSNPENYSSFVVTDDVVTFIFQEYQVAAYAFGAQEVSIPRIK